MTEKTGIVIGLVRAERGETPEEVAAKRAELRAGGAAKVMSAPIAGGEAIWELLDEGDTLALLSLRDLAASAPGLAERLATLQERSIGLLVLRDKIDTRLSPETLSAMLTLWEALSALGFAARRPAPAQAEKAPAKKRRPGAGKGRKGRPRVAPPEVIAEVVRRVAAGERQADLVREFGMKKSTVGSWVHPRPRKGDDATGGENAEEPDGNS